MWTRDDLIKARTKEITIEGGSMVIRALTASEAFQLRGKDMQSAEIFGLVSTSIVDPVLSPDDIGLLPTSIISQLTKEIFAFNGLGSKAVEDAVNELKKTDVLTSNSAAS
ncbi:MAG: hypothetical protein IPP74_15610 [Alphaproteobacteria bacterium]|nr:hypothetical protein [Alphaproteobacteria bacterium]